MKIVVLDGYTLNPGDISWKGLESFGKVTIYERTKFDTTKILKNIGDAEIVFTNKTPISKEVLNVLPDLKYIGVLATGYNVVDTEAAKKKGIIVTNVPTYGTDAVAQFTMAMLLEMCHHIGEHNRAVQKGDWSNSLDFCFWNYPLIELSGKTMGLIGFGRIGQATAKIAQAFGLKILFHTKSKKDQLETDHCKNVSLDDLLMRSDIISLHCPLNEDTKHIINKSAISKMKTGVLLINTSRGPLVLEEDLKDALNNGKIACAALDVVSVEPIKTNNPLLGVKNCIITPHIAWASKEARMRLMDTAVKNLQAYLNGKPENVVNY